MPKSETSNPNHGPSFRSPRYPPNWEVAIVCFLLGAMVIAALVDYRPDQSSFFSTSAPRSTNIVGPAGAETSRALLFTFGVGTFLVPIFIVRLFWIALRASRYLRVNRLFAMVLSLVSLSVLAAMLEISASDYFPQSLGGKVGNFIYAWALKPTIGTFGSTLIFATLYVCAMAFVFTNDLRGEFEKMFHGMRAWWALRRKRREELAAQRRQEAEIAAKAKASTAAAGGAAGGPAAATPQPLVGPSGKKPFVPKGGDDPLAKATAPRAGEPPATDTAKGTKPPPTAPSAPEPAKLELKTGAAGRSAATPAAAAAGATAPATDTKALAVGALGKVELNIVKPEEPKKAARVTLPQSDDANYQFPPLHLLKEQVRPSAGNSEEEHRQNAENLLRILSEFGVEVSLGEIHVGPVITRYEVVPAPGVRVEKISGLDKNIALGMRAQSVRILAPIPGKAAVGVEVPNQHPTPVGMRELLESEDWAGMKAEIPIALGKDVSGTPLISDLSKMPHLLIAGATGSGKSVCINSIVASILYSKSPKDLRLIMVDPKVVELKVFNSLPHMLIPVVTEPKKVPAALKWLLGEMEQRYQIFAKANVRNIVGFNNRKRGDKAAPPPAEAQASLEGVDPLDDIEVPERLPYIVAIIDELADLMMVAPAEIETSIARLAQLARAAGIHLIIATQRPSVNVITGVIKANLPSRIAFQVASQVDSRTILDTKGADTLIGRGDMLFSPPGTSRLVRAQGAFVSDDEVQEMVEFLKRNGPPQYAQSVQQQIDRAAREDDEDDEGGDEDGDLGDDEALYQQAIEVLKSTRRASTSMLQRRLRIGYNRAARLMEIMEEKGIVGPENGSSPREILVDLDTL